MAGVQAMQLSCTTTSALRASQPRLPTAHSSFSSSSGGACHFPALTPASAGSSGALAYRRRVTVMGNKATGGPFAPLVKITRNVMGTKEFNKFRGQGISLHSQVIKQFCQQIGADNKQIQGLIRVRVGRGFSRIVWACGSPLLERGCAPSNG